MKRPVRRLAYLLLLEKITLEFSSGENLRFATD